MAEYVFWGTTLSKQKSTFEWMIDQDRIEMKQFLAVKQIIIGEEAKDGELQIVEVEVGDEATMPIARLKKGGAEMCSLDIKFTNCPIKFSLVKGSGPVHVLGNHVLETEPGLLAADTDSEGMGEIDMEGEEEEEVMEEEEVEKPQVQAATKKRKKDDSDQMQNDGAKQDKKKKTTPDSGAKGKKGNSVSKSPPAKRKK